MSFARPSKNLLLLGLLIWLLLAGCLPNQAGERATPTPTAIAEGPAIKDDNLTATTGVDATDQVTPTELSPTASPAIPGGPLYPVVDADLGFLLGGIQGGRWVDAKTYAAYLQDTERPYSLYTLDGEAGVATGSRPVVTEGPCSQPVFSFDSSGDLAGAIALISRWDAAPRLAQTLSSDIPEYKAAVSEYLAQHGLAEAEVHIHSVFRIDLEGDGIDEILINARRLAGGARTPAVADGDYSMVILRREVAYVDITLLLALDVYPQANDLAYPFEYEVRGLLDLDGEGDLEIVLEGKRYEGRIVMVYEVTPSGAQVVLQAGCVQ